MRYLLIVLFVVFMAVPSVAPARDIGTCIAACAAAQGRCIARCQGDGQCIGACASEQGICVSGCSM